MELLERVAKYGFIFGASAAIIAALIGWYSYRTLVRKAAHTFLFMKYTERYEQIMAAYVFTGNPALERSWQEKKCLAVWEDD